MGLLTTALAFILIGLSVTSHALLFISTTNGNTSFDVTDDPVQDRWTTPNATLTTSQPRTTDVPKTGNGTSRPTGTPSSETVNEPLNESSVYKTTTKSPKANPTTGPSGTPKPDPVDEPLNVSSGNNTTTTSPKRNRTTGSSGKRNKGQKTSTTPSTNETSEDPYNELNITEDTNTTVDDLSTNTSSPIEDDVTTQQPTVATTETTDASTDLNDTTIVPETITTLSTTTKTSSSTIETSPTNITTSSTTITTSPKNTTTSPTTEETSVTTEQTSAEATTEAPTTTTEEPMTTRTPAPCPKISDVWCNYTNGQLVICWTLEGNWLGAIDVNYSVEVQSLSFSPTVFPVYPIDDGNCFDFTVDKGVHVDFCFNLTSHHCNQSKCGNTSAIDQPEPGVKQSITQDHGGRALAATFVVLVLIAVTVIVIYKTRRRWVVLLDRRRRRGTQLASISLNSITSPLSIYNRPIVVSDFEQHFNVMSVDAKLRFSVEFEDLNAASPVSPCTAALIPENQPKNRWTNILPFDHSRVKLLPMADDVSSDYINANYIPGYNSQREYIATQGPLPSTVDDFWRMVWEQGCTMIVMLTQCIERGKVKCEQYWPKDHQVQYYGDLAISLKSESILPEYTIRIFDLKLGSRVMEVKQTHFTMWPDFGCPESTQLLLSFIYSVGAHMPHCNPGPIIVHCSAGVGRTGTYIAVERLIQHVRDFDTVDVYHTVRDMRRYRNFMVQTEDQYVYIHECVRDYLKTLSKAPSERSATESQHFLNKIE